VRRCCGISCRLRILSRLRATAGTQRRHSHNRNKKDQSFHNFKLPRFTPRNIDLQCPYLSIKFFQTERWAELCNAAISAKLSPLPTPPGLAELTPPIQHRSKMAPSQLTLSCQFEIDGPVKRFQEKSARLNRCALCANRCSDELVAAACVSGCGLLYRCRLCHGGLARCGRGPLRRARSQTEHHSHSQRKNKCFHS
jgi:hypothetical protein